MEETLAYYAFPEEHSARANKQPLERITGCFRLQNTIFLT
jgi:hypothetical protein